MGAVNLHFFNHTARPTSNKILIFLQPLNPQPTYLYFAWAILNPSIGSSQTAILCDDLAASIASYEDPLDSHSMIVSLPFGAALQITNPNGQTPLIGAAGNALLPEQVGLENQATTPPTFLSVKWYLCRRLILETNNTPTTTLNPGMTMTLELQPAIYCLLAAPSEMAASYPPQIFNSTTAFSIPNAATDIYFEVYTETTGVDTFREITGQEFAQLEGICPA